VRFTAVTPLAVTRKKRFGGCTTVGPATRAKGIKPLFTEGLGRVGGLFDRRGTARRVKQPNADGYYQRHHNDHPKDESGDI
jgi:hypothetical protein